LSGCSACDCFDLVRLLGASGAILERDEAGVEDFDALEVEEIHFDEQFPEDTFASREPLPWR
jgi:hypothetical protein